MHLNYLKFTFEVYALSIIFELLLEMLAFWWKRICFALILIELYDVRVNKFPIYHELIGVILDGLEIHNSIANKNTFNIDFLDPFYLVVGVYEHS